MTHLRTLTPEELEAPFQTFTIEELHVGMHCTVRDPELRGQVGKIVCISIEHGRQEVCILFPDDKRPMGPFPPHCLFIIPATDPT